MSASPVARAAAAPLPPGSTPGDAATPFAPPPPGARAVLPSPPAADMLGADESPQRSFEASASRSTALPELPAEHSGSFADLLRGVQYDATAGAEIAAMAARFAEFAAAGEWDPARPVWRARAPENAPRGVERRLLKAVAAHNGVEEDVVEREVLVRREGRVLLLLPAARVADDFAALCADAARGDAGGAEPAALFVERSYAGVGLFGAAAAGRLRELLADRADAGDDDEGGGGAGGARVPARLAADIAARVDYATMLLSATDPRGMLHNFQRRCLAAAQGGCGSLVVDYCVPWHARDRAGRAAAADTARALRALLPTARLSDAEVAAVDRCAGPNRPPSWAVRLRCRWQAARGRQRRQ